MKIAELRSHLFTEYLADNAINDGAEVAYLDYYEIPCINSNSNDFVVVTSDTGAVYCAYDRQPILIGVYDVADMARSEAFSDEFIDWIRWEA